MDCVFYLVDRCRIQRLGFGHALRLRIQQFVHQLFAQVTTSFPFIRYLDQHRAHWPDDGRLVWEDPQYVGSPPDFFRVPATLREKAYSPLAPSVSP